MSFTPQNLIFVYFHGTGSKQLMGRLLLDRKLMKAGLIPENLSPLDRLCFIGCGGMGAISFEPENPNSATNLPTDLDEINHKIQTIKLMKIQKEQNLCHLK